MAEVPVLDVVLGDDAKDAEVPVRGVGRGGCGDGTGDLGKLVAVGGRPEGDGARAELEGGVGVSKRDVE